MNLLDIKDCPLSNEDVDALLRLFMEAKQRDISAGVDYYPHFQSTPQWQINVHPLAGCIVTTGQTLEEAIEKLFAKLQTDDKKTAPRSNSASV